MDRYNPLAPATDRDNYAPKEDDPEPPRAPDASPRPEPEWWERIDDLSGQLDMAISGLLANRGWRHTSSTPDSVWRWVKSIDGVMIMTSQRDALNIQQAMDSR